VRELTTEERSYLQLEKKEHQVWEGQGCKECRGTGYKGRTGIFEVLAMSERLRGLLTGSVELGDLTAAAREEGLVTLRQVAIRKMLEGGTTYEEVIAMTG
jgi:general secretion pathway protein E